MPPRIVLAADNSQISQYLTCPKSWYLKYIKNLSTRDTSRRFVAMDKGTVVHALMDVYYKCRGGNMPVNDSLATCYKTLDAQLAQKKLPDLSREDIFFIKQRFGLYVGTYINNDYQPMVINGKPQVEIGFSIPILDNSQYLFVLEGRIDLIDRREMFVDHKSQDRYQTHYPFDTQFLTYSLATGLKLGAVNYFGMQETPNKNTFHRLQLSFSHSHLERWKVRLIDIFKQMAYELYQVRDLGFESNTNEVSCKGLFGRACEFHTCCEATDERIQQLILLQQYEEKPRWEPWAIPEGDIVIA